MTRLSTEAEARAAMGNGEPLTKLLEIAPPCPTCAEIGKGHGPSHEGSKNCESGSIASGGRHAHCACDRCF